MPRKPDDTACLTDRFRQLAEELARKNTAALPGGPETLTPEAIQETLHELRVHQIQLEMQNEELRRIQVELDATRSRYFDLYDVAPVGYLTVSEAGVVLEGNLTAATLLGMPRGRLAGQPVSNFIHPRDQDVFYQLRARLPATGEARSCELRIVRRDGVPRWVQLAATAVRDADGVTELRVMLNDIHASKVAELILEVRVRLLELVPAGTLAEILRATLDEAESLTGSSIGFYHFVEADQDTLSLQAWSSNTERNLCRVEGAGRHYPVAEAGVWVDCIREGRAVIHNDYASLPHRKGLPAGHARVQRELVVPVRRGGRVVAILGVGNRPVDYLEEDIRTIMSLADLAWDIVEKVRVEEALRKSQHLLEETGRVGMVGGWEVFIESGTQTWTAETYRIHEMDPSYQPTVAEGIGFYTPASRPVIEQALQRTIESGEPFDVELEILTAKGNLRGVKAIGKLDREHSRVYGFFQDITERKLADDVRDFLARTGSGTADEPFFNALARYLAQSLGMECVCIDRLEGDGLTGRTLVFWCDGRFEDNVIYALKDTPCGAVVEQAVCCYPAGVCECFPHDAVLRDLRAESYAGVTLWSHASHPIGLIAVIGRKPLDNRARVEATLMLVAERAAGELERLQAELALKVAEWKFHALFENSLIGVAYHRMVYDTAGRPVDYRFLDANPIYRELTGVDPRGMLVTEAFPGIENDPFDWIGTFGRVAQGGETVRFEQHLQSNGRWYDCVGYPYKPDHFVVAFMEITERKRTEAVLRETLLEKESLLKEIHHRVKNNLQIISSLLRLQSNQIDDSSGKAALLDMQNRVRSMALIHEHLYRSEHLAAVDLPNYLRQLCNQLFRVLVLTPDRIRLLLDLAPLNLEIDQAIPCGLLVNELVTNAFKHAFPEGSGGEVRVELRAYPEGSGWLLRVADNGVGLPPDLDPGNLTSLGLKLVADLSRQLGGRLTIGAGPGAVFEVECR